MTAVIEAFQLLDERYFGSQVRLNRFRSARVSRLSALREGAEPAESPQDDDGVVGVGIGKPPTSTADSEELCVRVYVRKKFPLDEIPPTRRVPERVGSVPVHVG